MNSKPPDNLTPSQLLLKKQKKCRPTFDTRDEVETGMQDSSSMVASNIEVNTAEIKKITGKYANVHWKSISLEHLRLHPFFECLPESKDIKLDTLVGFEDCNIFCQSSWQWDALHVGRLTTSNLSSCLGFYENAVAEFLDIPHSLRSHDRVVASWNHLTRKAFSWDQFQELLKANHHSSQQRSHEISSSSSSSARECWKKPDAANCQDSFAYSYQPDSNLLNNPSRHYSNPHSARLAWGSAQEATAILTAVNFFAQLDCNTRISESGMCTFESAWRLCEQLHGRNRCAFLIRLFDKKKHSILNLKCVL